MRTLLASLPMLVACVTSPSSDDSAVDLDGGKADGASAVRSATLVVDRRPVDGALTEIHIVPVGTAGAKVVIDSTTLSRTGERHRHEVLIANGSCGMGLDEITCEEDPDVANVVFSAVRTGDTWTATASIEAEERALGTGMRATHLRFSRADAARHLLIQLTIDVRASGQVVTLRKTPTDGREIYFEPSTLMTKGTCAVEAGELTCVEDQRPVDGALKELRVTLVTPGGPYRATLHTSARRLDGDHDSTETLADELDLR